MQYQQQAIDQDVFRAYDIRGIIGKQLDENSFYTVGLALSCRLRALDRSTVLLARDGRLSSANLARALSQGLLDSGIDVVDLGEVTTPMMYYATNITGIDSGLMVTGSHNPADYNGIKMVLAGTTLAQTDIQLLYDLVVAATVNPGCGSYSTLDISSDYQQRILSDIQLQRPFKVVVDCGNGIAGPTVPVILKALGCEVIPLYCEVDGRFPNHHPDPTVAANLADLITAVHTHKADIGLAFDGDADRLGVVTEAGEIICPDRLMMFYSQFILQKNPGATIVFDVKCSSNLAKVIEDAGGVAVMCSTGHSLVKATMKHKGAALAGEMSGHLFFKDRWYGFDDALYSACRLLESLSGSKSLVGTQFAAIPNSINTPELQIPIADAVKFDFMKRFAAKASFPNARLITIDGLRIEFDYGWGLLRASNTTPCLVARFEATDDDYLQQIQTMFKQQLMAVDDKLAIPF